MMSECACVFLFLVHSIHQAGVETENGYEIRKQSMKQGKGKETGCRLCVHHRHNIRRPVKVVVERVWQAGGGYGGGIVRSFVERNAQDINNTLAS